MRSRLADFFPTRELIDLVFIASLASVLVLIMFFLQGDIIVDHVHEGYIWYGVRAILKYGDIPRVQFAGYDPGRYYWSVLWSPLFGDGLIGLRISTHIFQVIGLVAGIWSLHTITDKKWWLIIWSILLAVWVFPPHKMVETTLSMTTLLMGIQLLNNHNRKHFFFAGLYTGIVTFWGINHGGYALASFVCLAVFIHTKVTRIALGSSAFYFTLGGILGSFPQFLLILLEPDYIYSFIHLIHTVIVNQGDSNVPLSIPFIWKQSILSNLDFQTLVLSLGFTIMPIYYGVALLVLIRAGKNGRITRNPCFVASVLVGVFYSHQAFSRADYPHLAQTIHPLLISIFSLAAFVEGRTRKWVCIGSGLIISIASIGGIVQQHPIIQFLQQRDMFVKHSIDDYDFWMIESQSRFYSTIQNFADAQILPDEQILILPYDMILYPMLDQRSPIWELYPLFRISDDLEDEMIEDVRDSNVRWLLFQTDLVDSNPDLALSVLYPKLWAVINEIFEPYEVEGLPANRIMYARSQEP